MADAPTVISIRDWWTQVQAEHGSIYAYTNKQMIENMIVRCEAMLATQSATETLLTGVALDVYKESFAAKNAEFVRQVLPHLKEWMRRWETKKEA